MRAIANACPWISERKLPALRLVGNGIYGRNVIAFVAIVSLWLSTSREFRNLYMSISKSFCLRIQEG